MKWSLRIARVAGIDIFIHWTFWLLFIYLGFAFAGSGEGPAAVATGLAFVAAVFGCVVLHELGHALAARQCGVRTRDIVLFPIGGVARLERIPEAPSQELWIAIAGPLVNVVIAGILALVVPREQWFELSDRSPLDPKSFLNSLLRVNVALFAFNLLPAFPMDGGRMLRAILAYGMSHARATELAAGVGQLMAILFGIVGIMWNPMLLFIALFVFLGAEGEARSVQLRTVLAGVRVGDAMITEFHTLDPDETLERASQQLLSGSQQDFPVVQNGRLVGMLWRNKLFAGLQQGGPQRLVREFMESDCQTVTPSDPLDEVLARMRSIRCPSLPVLDHGRLAGLLTNENILELITIRQVLGELMRPSSQSIA